MMKIKALTYKSDASTPCLKTLTAEVLEGTALLYTHEQDEWDNHDLYTYYFLVEGDLAYPLTRKISKTPQEMAERWSSDELKAFCTKETLVKGMQEGNFYCGKREIMLAELLGMSDLAKELTARREQHMRELAEKAEAERLEQEQERERERARRAEEQARKAELQLQEAEQKLREGKFITTDDFENLCNKYQITLPMKFVGWLRKYCGDISITPYSDEEKKYYANDYHTQYYLKDWQHKSTTMSKHCDKLATALGL